MVMVVDSVPRFKVAILELSVLPAPLASDAASGLGRHGIAALIPRQDKLDEMLSTKSHICEYGYILAWSGARDLASRNISRL